MGQDELSAVDLRRLADLGRQDLYFFSRGILKYRDLNPRTHRDLCTFLTQDPARRKLVLMPRSHFKSTLGTIADTLRILCVNPNIRILLANESGKNAQLFLEEAKQHILQNQVFRSIYHDIIPNNINETTWNREEILLPRTLIAREPSITAIGVGGAVVSRHYDFFKFDDLIGEEALNSPSVMETAISWLNHSVSLLTRPEEDSMHLIGTRWAYNDLYAHAIEKLGFKVFRRKAVVINSDTGELEPLFNSRFSLDFFAGIMQADPAQWAAQYANDPSDVAFADFQKSWLRYYRVGRDGNLRWNDFDGTLNIQELTKLRIYIHVDPSVGDTPNADEQAVMVVGVNELGQVFLLDAWQLRVDPILLVEKIFEMHDRFHPKLVSIESTAFQKSLRYFIDKEASRRQTYLHIEDYKPSTRKSKEARIRGALQPYFSSGMIFVRENQFSFIEQYLAFGRTDQDHMMDALAQGPQFWKAPRDDVGLSKHTRVRDHILRGRTNYGLSGYGI